MAFEKVALKYGGNYYEWPLTELDLVDPTDDSIKTAVMAKLGPATNLSDFVVGPPETERLSGQHDDKTVINIHPTATLGK